MGGGFPILLVEDNPVSRKLIEKTLQKAGHEVSNAANGRQALEIFREKFFPIVITDWMMPEIDGLELCRAIRSKTAERYVYIIILTARDSKDDIVERRGRFRYRIGQVILSRFRNPRRDME